VLPIDGRPVIVTLLDELRTLEAERVTVVTGHLAEQIERLLDGLPLELLFVRQPEPLGSADAVRRAAPRAPALAVAADTLFAAGDIARFASAASGADGAIAVRATPPQPRQTRIKVADGRVVRVPDADPQNPVTGAPLWFLNEPVVAELDSLTGPPFELAAAFQRAVDNGNEVRAIQIGKTRDLTDALDLIRENVPYLRGIE
jgi:NDP-sugar pyrophosphorylase family protein